MAIKCQRFAEKTEFIQGVEKATHAFAPAGLDLQFQRVSNPRAFGLEITSFRMGVAQIVHTSWTTDAAFSVEFASRVAVIVNPTQSKPSFFTTRSETLAASDDSAPILEPLRKTNVFRPGNSPIYIMSAEKQDLQRLLSEIVGTQHKTVEFQPMLERSSPAGRRLQRVVDFIIQELTENPAAIDHPIIRRQFDDLLTSTLLLMPGSHLLLLDRSKSPVTSAIVRRAEEFMEGNLGRGIGMSEVAEACGCSRTKLFEAFKNERDWTPLQFLTRRRLEWARRRLLAPTDNTNVTSISLDCGYANFGRFAQVYRAQYGETPSATLRRSR